ncbi:MAG: hypothetical protein Q8Q09_10260 [Deltaproteobacteria bacterium]|nr:hypothetical protein [Deltaproteobacteria bacterium]
MYALCDQQAAPSRAARLAWYSNFDTGMPAQKAALRALSLHKHNPSVFGLVPLTDETVVARAVKLARHADECPGQRVLPRSSSPSDAARPAPSGGSRPPCDTNYEREIYTFADT